MPGGFIPHPISGLPEAWSLVARVGGNACLRWGWGLHLPLSPNPLGWGRVG